MPRHTRHFGQNQIYHVMLRGIDLSNCRHQGNIFFDKSDALLSAKMERRVYASLIKEEHCQKNRPFDIT